MLKKHFVATCLTVFALSTLAAPTLPMGPTLSKMPAPKNSKFILEKQGFRDNDKVYREYFLLPELSKNDSKPSGTVIVRTNDGKSITENKTTYFLSSNACQKVRDNTAQSYETLSNGQVVAGDVKEWNFYDDEPSKPNTKLYYIYLPEFVIGTEICKSLDPNYYTTMKKLKAQAAEKED